MILSPTTPTRVGIERITHPIPGRADVAYELDFIVKAANYQAPTYGSVDEYGTLIAESDTSPAGGACVTFTRTYIRELPESWSEVQEYTLQHDEFIDVKGYDVYSVQKDFGKSGVTVDGGTYTTSYAPPDPPTEEQLPKGAKLIRTIYIPGGWVNDGPPHFSTVYGKFVQDVKWYPGGLKWVYEYEVDPETRVNLIVLKEQADSNTNLTSLFASTASVKIKTSLNYSYHILPNGPQPSDMVHQTYKTKVYGSSILSWPRLLTTVLEPSSFQPVLGCLYRRTIRKWGGL